jgi:phosphate transport system permease protein
MFTAALAHKDKLPWQDVNSLGGFFSQSVQAMPYHIYTVAARIPQSEYTKPMQYGSVFVFMVLVMSLAALSVFLRIHYRKRVKW